MVEDVMYVAGLSGEEIVTDLTDQIAAKLRNDCNFRGNDSYTGGYSAEITMKIHLYGLDTVDSEMVLKAGKPNLELPSTVVEEEVIIAHEPDLQKVRERSDQEEGTLEHDPTAEPRQKRKYNKRVPAFSGGATDDTLEQE